jgi:hypothetical protein
MHRIITQMFQAVAQRDAPEIEYNWHAADKVVREFISRFGG